MAKPKTITYKSTKSLPRKKRAAKKKVVIERITTKGRAKGKSRSMTETPQKLTRPNLLSMDSRALASSIINPFMGSVCVPDGFEGGCFSLQQQAPVVSDANGFAAFSVAGDPWNLFANITGTGTGTGWNIPAANVWTSSVNVATVSNVYAKLRVISMAIKFVCTQSTTTDQGGIICAEIPGNYVLSTFNAQGAASFGTVEANCTNSTTGSVRDGCLLTWRPEDSNNMFNYSSYYNGVATYGTQPTISGVPYLFLGIVGAAPSTTFGRVEFIVNFQGQFKNTTYFAGNALETQPKAEVGWMEKVINAVKLVPQFVPLIGDIAGAFVPGGGLVGRMAKLAMS